MPRPPIVCVSANPAMDRRLFMESLAAGEIDRAKSALGLAGGQAAHVAMTVRALEAPAVWVGFLGGAIGQGARGKSNCWASRWLQFPRDPARASIWKLLTLRAA